LFVLGLLILAAMAFLSSWPDLEASMFDSTTPLSAKASLRELRCPIMVAAGETAAVRAHFTNRSDRKTSFLVRSRISRGLLTYMRQDSRVIALEPGQSEVLSWPITAADAAYGRLVLARVFTTRSGDAPARQTACGILVVNVPGLPGDAVFLLGVLAGLVALGAGAAWWVAQRRPLGARDDSLRRGFGVLTLIVCGSLVAGVLGWWLPSHALLILAVLVVGALFERHVVR
jgi:hypothetical protein